MEGWHLFSPLRTALLAHMLKKFSGIHVYFLVMRPVSPADPASSRSAHELDIVMTSDIFLCKEQEG